MQIATGAREELCAAEKNMSAAELRRKGGKVRATISSKKKAPGECSDAICHEVSAKKTHKK